MIEILGGKCAVCGSTDRLEFDHRDPDKKEADFTDIRGRGWEYFMREVEKCQLLCKKHHIDKTLSDNGMTRTTHGKIRCYQNGCRCVLCKQASRDSSRKYRAHKKSLLLANVKVANLDC